MMLYKQVEVNSFKIINFNVCVISMIAYMLGWFKDPMIFVALEMLHPQEIICLTRFFDNVIVLQNCKISMKVNENSNENMRKSEDQPNHQRKDSLFLNLTTNLSREFLT